MRYSGARAQTALVNAEQQPRVVPPDELEAAQRWYGRGDEARDAAAALTSHAWRPCDLCGLMPGETDERCGAADEARPKDALTALRQRKARGDVDADRLYIVGWDDGYGEAWRRHEMWRRQIEEWLTEKRVERALEATRSPYIGRQYAQELRAALLSDE